MRCSLLSVALLLVASSASPLAGVDQPITDEEFAKINELGFNRRNAPIAERTVVDQPITDEEYTKISALGLDKRETLDARNNRKSCGKTINGERAGGHGVWCPVDQYLAVVNQFCTEYAGAQVRYQYKLSHTYSVFLTNQDHASERGPPGIVICKSISSMFLPAFCLVKKNQRNPKNQPQDQL